MRIRNFAFDSGIFQIQAPGVPVVSIGNLTAGGTGKTPLTMHLLSEFKRRGISVAVVSRGYGGIEKGPSRVSVASLREASRRFGDEPALIASSFPDVPVYVGANRALACRELLKVNKPRLIIADDAFQHRWLARGLNIVVFDVTEPLENFRPLPVGRMREGFAALRRAQVVVFTKCNLADDDRVQKLVAHELSVRELRPILLAMQSEISEFKRLGEKLNLVPAREFQGRKVLLVSGIGRPATFRSLVEKSTGAQVEEHRIYRDHHLFTEQDSREINQLARLKNVDAIFVTEKDAVKLEGFNFDVPVWVSQLRVVQLSESRPGELQTTSRGDFMELYEAIDRLLL